VLTDGHRPKLDRKLSTNRVYRQNGDRTERGCEISEDSDAYWSASSAVYKRCIVIRALQSSRCSYACTQTILRG